MARLPLSAMTPGALVTRWHDAVTEKTLANWRSMRPRRGPSFFKVGRNRNSPVLYPLKSVVAYEKALTVETGRKHGARSHHHRG